MKRTQVVLLAASLLGMLAAGARPARAQGPELEPGFTVEPGRRAHLGVVLGGMSGVHVLDVLHDSAADRADIREGDELVEIDGTAIESAAAAGAAISGRKAGDTVAVKVRRDGRDLLLSATLAARPERPERAAGRAGKHCRAVAGHGKVRLGVELLPIGEGLRAHFRVPAGQGVLVSEVSEGGAAAAAGLKPGDVILSVAGQPVTSAGEAVRALDGVEPLTPVAVVIVRDGAEQTIDVRVEERRARDFSEAPREWLERVAPEVHESMHEALEEVRRSLGDVHDEIRRELKESLEDVRREIHALRRGPRSV